MYTRWSARHSQISTIGLFLLYPQLSSTVLKSVNCKTVEGRSWLVADMSVDCLSPEYITHRWVSLFFLFLYPIGIPAFLAWKLEQKKHILFSHFAVSDLGFLDKFSTDECGDMYRIYGTMKMNVVQCLVQLFSLTSCTLCVHSPMHQRESNCHASIWTMLWSTEMIIIANTS